jgi:PAXIP1-associated protein 1
MSNPPLWRPAPDRIIALHEAMADRTGPAVIELLWKNPGRRPLVGPQEAVQEVEEEAKPESSTNHMDFDMDDEDESVGAFSTPTRGRTPGQNLKGSARKKTTSLDNVLSNMRRHRIEEKEYTEPEKKS